MKRVGDLFDSVCSFGNLLRAARRAQAGKRYRRAVLLFNLRLEANLIGLQRELREGVYHTRGHRHFLIHEPKERWISAAPYRDRVVHHALCQVIEPVLDRRMIYDSWANRKGKGSHRAVLRCQRFSRLRRCSLKMDIRKYFPAIDHEIMKSQLRRVFKDPRLIVLLERIVDEGTNPEPFPYYFPGDDLFTPYTRRRGLPIGNLTSQLFANVYLDDFDHWVKEQLGVEGYLRFVDDFVLFADDPAQLRSWQVVVGERLEELRLLLHPRKCVIRRGPEGIPFLGYVVWPDRIRVRGETVRRFRRRFRSIRGRGASEKAIRLSLDAWKGHVRLAGSHRRRRTVLS